MKSILLHFVMAMVIISCKQADKKKQIDYSGFTDREISLAGYDERPEWNDSLAYVSLKIPVRLDTFYKWQHYSCNTSSGWMKYRFADKCYPQFAESGWYWTVVPDSVYQINIWHKPIKIAPDSITLRPLSEKDTVGCFYHPHIVSSPKSVNFLLKEFKLINERPFIISAFVNPYGYLTHSQTLFVVAETNLKSRELYFIGECGTKDTTGFIDNMYKSFLSIRIKENP